MDAKGEITSSKLLITSPSASYEESNNNERLGVQILIEAESFLNQEVKQREGYEYGDGYHTPTSPTRRIPAPIRCPPAPRKPSSSSSLCSKKRKRSRGMDAEESGSFTNSSPELEEFVPVIKKKTKKMQQKGTAHAEF